MLQPVVATPAITYQCASDIMPASVGAIIGLRYYGMDVDFTDSNYVLCGNTMNTIVTSTTGQLSSFVQSYNSVWNLVFHITLEFQTTSYIGEYCKYATASTFYTFHYDVSYQYYIHLL